MSEAPQLETVEPKVSLEVSPKKRRQRKPEDAVKKHARQRRDRLKRQHKANPGLALHDHCHWCNARIKLSFHRVFCPGGECRRAYEAKLRDEQQKTSSVLRVIPIVQKESSKSEIFVPLPGLRAEPIVPVVAKSRPTSRSGRRDSRLDVVAYNATHAEKNEENRKLSDALDASLESALSVESKPFIILKMAANLHNVSQELDETEPTDPLGDFLARIKKLSGVSHD
jgi:hypothetical protein